MTDNTIQILLKDYRIESKLPHGDATICNLTSQLLRCNIFLFLYSTTKWS